MLPTGREFSELISPHGIRAFFKTHWHRRPLFIGGWPEKFSAFGVDLAVVESIIRERKTKRRLEVRYVGPDTKRKAGSDTKLKEAPEALDSYSIRDGDLTVCIDWISDRLEVLGAYCSGIKAALSIPGSVFMTCYASPDGHGFGTHFDCNPTFILQLEGSKRWRYSAKPAVEWPPANLSNAAILPEMMERYGWLEAFRFPDAKEEEEFLEQVLSPGDALFLPPGTWHRATAIGCSVALTMNCTPRTAADFFDDVIRAHLSRSVEWRHNVPAVPADAALADRFSPEVARFFARRLSELKRHVRSLTAGDLYESWTHHVHAFDTPFSMEVDDQAVDVHDIDVLSLSSEFPFQYVVSPQQRAVSLYYLDKRIDLSIQALPLVHGMITHSSFSARQAAEWLGPGFDWKDAKPVVDELARAGILQVRARG